MYKFQDDPFTVGFDRLFDRLHTMNTRNQSSSNYPPYNIIKTDENSYCIELAVAGFTEEQLDITVEDGVLEITGTPDLKDLDDTSVWIHKGISGRTFKRTFTLADTVVVKDAELLNGILCVKLENIIPEEKKPRKIAITRAVEPELLTEGE